MTDPHRPDAETPAEPLAGVPEVYRLLVASLTDYAVVVLDPRGIVRSWNPGARHIKGYTADEIVGTSFERFYTPESLAVDHPARELELAAATGRYEEEGWRVRRDGTRFWAHIVITALHDDDGTVVGFGKVVRDLTERKQSEEQLANTLRLLRASMKTDLLTGVVNRGAWDDALAAAIERSVRTGRPLSVAMVDVDHFKALNDEHGHAAGDRFLRRATSAWRDTLRTSDVLARLGGEEFAIALPDCPLESARDVADRVRSLTPPEATCSIGVVEWHPDERASDVVRRADEALYAAKGAGRNRVVAAAHPQAAPDPA